VRKKGIFLHLLKHLSKILERFTFLILPDESWRIAALSGDWIQSRVSHSRRERKATRQGCQMVYFQTKNPNLGKF
jgi:hypothetical protein